MRQRLPAVPLSSDLAPFWTSLAPRYRLERELRRGGMATVYLVQDLRHARPVALKLINPDLAATLAPRRFLREIQLAARLDHPHILPVYDSGEDAGRLWYVMPYVEGGSLRDRLRREVRLPVRDAVRIARGIADALEYAHARDVIHRDIKPENILLAQGHARLADFGIARAAQVTGEELTRAGLVVGTPKYMAPEHSGGEPVDFRSDLYSLACMLYEMLAGDAPYTGPSAHAVIVRSTLGPAPAVRAARPEVPEALEALISRNLSAERSDRSASASAFAAALEESLTAAVTPAYPPLPDASGVGASERGRDAYRRRAWSEAYAQLTAADRGTPLEPEDLEQLAVTCTMLGRETESAGYLARAYQAYQRSEAPERAARAAFWLILDLMDRGDVAQASGWIGRVRRLLSDIGHDCAEQGFVLLPDALRALAEGDHETALPILDRVIAIGERFGDSDLIAFARLAQGRTLLRSGRVQEGVALLDEAMLAVTTDEVTPIVAGGVYCSVVSGCQEVFDWRRAQEWTAAMSRWCAPQPDLVLFRGQCLLRRSEVLQLRGDWDGALEEARRALARLLNPPNQIALGAAYVQLADLHRLRGELAEAEEAYRLASQHGKRIQPGLALLRMAQGDPAAALASLRRALDETTERRFRPMLLAACVDVGVAAGELPTARTAAAELAAIAAEVGVPYLRALSARATGAVHLAEGDTRRALGELRASEATWQELEAPYEAARTRVLIGRACGELGDGSEAEMSFAGAAAVFERLGAEPDVTVVEQVRSAGARGA
ncbi:MAG TPA: serine/threonine-protein kinase [Gemmatimonadales bacterium]|nr:serine/threonine-protein kinase [Gemmatimonadales bacterium]